VYILTGLHEVEAEVAASRLRAAGINAQVVRDNEALLGVGGSTSLGTFSVSIPESAEDEARRLLRTRSSPRRRGR
jgi:Putative prokaryotic signal transducing protein